MWSEVGEKPVNFNPKEFLCFIFLSATKNGESSAASVQGGRRFSVRKKSNSEQMKYLKMRCDSE